MGLMNDLEVCSLCDTEYRDGEIVYLHPSNNTFCCSSCFAQSGSDYLVRFTPGMMRYFLYTTPLVLEEAVNVQLGETTTKKIVYALVDYMNTILGYSLKSLVSSFLFIS
mgnify:CR=1 FL=1